MGVLPATTNQPSCKFVTPTNNQDIAAANTPFTMTLAITGMQTGNFVNAQTNYFAAPQTVNAQGQIVGHSHMVVQALTSLTQTTPINPTQFAFFQGLDSPAVNGQQSATVGQLSATVAKGLPAGCYKVSTINTAANHQPVVGPVAQHGSFDDAVYFTVGGGCGGAAGAAANTTATAAVAGAANSTAAAANSTAAGSAAAAGGNGAAAGTAAGGKAGKGGKRSARFIREYN